MERTALSLQSFRGPRLFLFVSSLAHVVQHMWDLGSPSRNGALWPLQGKHKSPNHWAAQGVSCHVNTSLSLQISGGWGATGDPFRVGRAVTGPQPMLPPTDGRPARAPSAQSGGVYTSSLPGGPHWASFCQRKTPPQAVATATGHPHLAGDGRSPGTPCTHWPVRRLPGALPASLPWVGPGERCLQPSWPLSLGPKLSCLASWVVPEPKMHGHCPIYCK